MLFVEKGEKCQIDKDSIKRDTAASPQNREVDYFALAAGDVDYRDLSVKPQTGHPMPVTVSYREDERSNRQRPEVYLLRKCNFYLHCRVCLEVGVLLLLSFIFNWSSYCHAIGTVSYTHLTLPTILRV